MTIKKMAYPFTRHFVEVLIEQDTPASLDELLNMFLLTDGCEESMILIIQRLLTTTIRHGGFDAAQAKFNEVGSLMSEEDVTTFSTWLGLNG
jgi:hypothetical protein